MGVVKNVAERLRASKPAWALYNLAHYRQLRGNAEHYRRLGIRKPVVGSIAHRDVARHEAEQPWLDRPDAHEALEAHPDLDSFPPHVQEQLRSWIDHGYIVLEGHLSEAEVDEINDDLDRLFQKGVVRYHPRGPRIMNAHKQCEPITRAVRHPELLRLLGFVLGRDVTLFQTINFFEGSQQDAHSDSFHMTTEPVGYLTAIWVALEDVTPESGPLFYYPGSHKLGYVMTEDLTNGERSRLSGEEKDRRYEERIAALIEERGMEPVEFLARKGDLLVWHANLLHGGRGITREGATRKSLVAHYFAKGVLCYHEVTERPAIVEA
jgi:hypothetical protein